jgi:PAS domain S-box-containing protein
MSISTSLPVPEAQLSSPAALCQKLLTRLSAVAFELTPEGTTRYVSQGLTTLAGYTPSDALGRNWWEFLCQGEQLTQVPPLLNSLHTGDVAGYPLSVTAQSGRHLAWEIDTVNHYGPAGELRAIVGYALARTSAEPALPAQDPLAESTDEAAPSAEFRFRLALQNAPVSVAAQDRQLRFTWAYNQRSVQPAAVIGKTDADLFPPETAAKLVALKHRVLDTGVEVREQLWLTSGGHHLFVDLYLEPLRNAAGQIVGIGIATVDLTQQKRTEDALRESESRYRTLFETMQEGFALYEMVFDEQGSPCDYRFLEINPTFEALTGLQAADVLGRTASEVFPESTRSLLDNFRQAAASCRPEHIEFYYEATRRTYTATLYCPQPGQMVTVFTDVTARKETEAQIRFQANLLNVVEQAVIATDTAGRITYWNRFAEKLYGWAAAEALGQRLIDLIAGSHSPADQTALLSHLQTAASQMAEFSVQRRDGSHFPVQITHSPILDDQGTLIGHVGISIDISENRRAQTAREQHLGRLGRLIHASHQILAATTYTDLLQSIAKGARELTESQVSAAGHGFHDGHFQSGATSRVAGSPGTLTADQMMLGPNTAYLSVTMRDQPFRLSTEEAQRLLANRDLPAGHRPLRNLVGAPLVGQGEQWRGMLIASNKIDGEFSAEDEAMLTQLANLGSLALQHIEAHQEAAQKAAEFATVFNALTDAVMVYSDQLQLIQANPAACAAFGFDPTASPPQPPAAEVALLYPDRRPVPPELWPWQCALRGETLRNERYIFTRAGRPDINILASAAPLQMAGQTHGAVATWHDVTERDQLLVELENERRRWLATVESMLDYVIVTDAKGQETYLNSAYAQSLRHFQSGNFKSLAQPTYPGLFRSDGPVQPLGTLPLLQALRRNAPLENMEMLEITPSGDERVILWSASPIRDAQDEVAGAVAVGHDITPQKATEQALRVARDELEQRVHERAQAVFQANEELRAEIAERLLIERQLRLQTTALQSAANGIVIADREGVILWVNPAFTHLTGFTPEECLGRTLRILRSGEHSPAYYQAMWQTILAGKVWHGEIINCHKLGQTYMEEQTITPVIDPDGQVSHFISIKQDITERKRTEQALLRANALLQRVFDSIDLLIAYLDRDFNFLRVNRAYAESEGHPPEFFIGQNHFVLYPNAENEAVFRRVVETGEAYTVFEQPFIYAAQQSEASDESYWDWNLQPVKDAEGQVLGLVFSLANVTFRKLAQDQLRQNARQSQMLAEVSQALAEAKLDSQSVADTVAYHMGQLFGDLCLIRLLSDDGQRLKLVAYHCPDPELRPTIVQQIATRVVKVGEGIAGRVVVTGQPAFVPIVTSEKDLVAFGPEYRSILKPMRPSLLAVPLRAQGRTLGVMTLFRIGRSQPYTSEDLTTAQNLADRAALAIANAHLYQDLEAALAQEQAVRTQMVQVEKLAGMGRMVASVAHELNNPLQTIKNCLYLTHKDLPPDSPIHQYLDMATSETKRLAHLVAQLREVYRPRFTGHLQPLNLLPLLAEVPILLGAQIENHQIQWQLTTNLSEAVVLGLADQLKQVFLNLAQNAVEAMPPEGGLLTVTVTLSEDERHVAVAVSDTGEGIPDENLDHLFEPFFTTKFTGLGMGLAICNDIIQRHGGKLTVESQLGRGTTFTVWLPRGTLSA